MHVLRHWHTFFCRAEETDFWILSGVTHTPLHDWNTESDPRGSSSEFERQFANTVSRNESLVVMQGTCMLTAPQIKCSIIH